MAQAPRPKPSPKQPRQLTAADLPDPLLNDSQDVPMASAEDLLSEIVGDDVERLMSGEYEPVRGGSKPTTTGRKAVEQVQQQLGTFLEELRHRERAAPPAPEPRRIHEDDLVSPLDDLIAPSHEELEALHSGEYEPAMPATPSSTPFARTARGPAESAALLAPVNAFDGEPTYLKPLDWLSAPIARLSARGRVAVSMLAIVLFLGGCAALGYVLMLRHGGV